MENQRKKWAIFIAIALSTFGIDYISKKIVLANIEPGETIPVIGDIFSWHLVFNKGALFGFNPSAIIPWLSNNIFFYIFSAVALVVLLNFVREVSAKRDPLSFIGASLVFGGAMGNLLDRIIRPDLGVVDFFMVNLGFKLGPIPFDPWPIFNFADIWIDIGIIALFIASFIPTSEDL